MVQFIKFIVGIINELHDKIIVLLDLLGLNFTDKELHFWVFGIAGIILFVFVDKIFKWISKWSITAISFIYTITFLIIMVLAIEIQQKITGRGNMEFNDALASILGFLAFFGVYVVMKLLLNLSMNLYKGMTENKRIDRDE